MIRLIIMGFAMLMLNACQAQDETYYRLNPIALQNALKNCPQQRSQGVSCEQLSLLNNQVKQLGYELQMNPQRFGQKILSLQEMLARQHAALKQDPKQSELKSQVQNNQQKLAEYMAIVRWLESPEG